MKATITIRTRVPRKRFSTEPKSGTVLPPPPKEFTPTAISERPIERTTVPVTTGGKNLLSGLRQNPNTPSNIPPIIQAPIIAA